MIERWASIPGWPAYEASTLGRVRSVDRQAPNGNGRTYKVKGRLLTPQLKGYGYLVVTLRAGQAVRRIAFVHRLVAYAFIPNPDGKPNINHIDCNPANNRVENLEWCTQRENLAHMDRLGRRGSRSGHRGPWATLTEEQVRAMRLRRASGGVTYAQIAAELGISKSSAMRCAKGETYAYVL